MPLRLTPRESEVLALVVRGLENKAIAAELGIAEQSVKVHVSALLQKFRVPNRAALAETAIRRELTGEPGIDRTWISQLFRHADPLICVLRGPELRYEAVNEAFRRATGNRPVMGRTMREAFPELEGQGIFEHVERVYADGQSTFQHERTTSWDRGNGIERRSVDLVLQPLRDEDGVVNGVLSFAVDVTDAVQQRTPNDLLREELAAAVDLLPAGVVITDGEGRIVRANPAARRIARTPSDLTRLVRELAACPGDLSFTAGDPPQTIRVHGSVRPLQDPDGGERGAVTVFTELT